MILELSLSETIITTRPLKEYCEEKFIYFVKDVPVKITTHIGLLNRHYAFYNQSRIKVAPVHDYYQMSGLRLTNNSIKLLNV